MRSTSGRILSFSGRNGEEIIFRCGTLLSDFRGKSIFIRTTEADHNSETEGGIVTVDRETAVWRFGIGGEDGVG